MHIVFDPDFDHGCWPGPLRGDASAGEDWLGPSRLAQVLETALGMGGPAPSERERAARLVPTVRASEGFWSASAEVDPFGTARRLLFWRDTLAMGGWRGDGTASRLAALAGLTAACPPGLPDRLHAINQALERRSAGIESIELLVPLGDLEPLWRRTLALLTRRGTRVIEAELTAAPARPGSDLMGARAEHFEPAGDGSLWLLRPAGPLAAAEEVAAWLSFAGGPRDTVIIGGDPALDAALHRHGLPATGAPYRQRDLVTLQLLPLVLELGWTPPDPQRAYELLSLRSGLVPAEIAWRLSDALGRWPAVDSDAWREALAEGLEKIEDAARRERVRRRLDVLWTASVPRASAYPVGEVIRRAGTLRTWLLGRAAAAQAGKAANHAGNNTATEPAIEVAAWHAAAAQCNALLDLVQHSGLAELTAAQLRHLAIEATGGVGAEGILPAQAGLRRVGTPGGVAGPARLVIWWRFDASSSPGLTRLPLTAAERSELGALGVELTEPAKVAAAHARRWRRPLEQAVEGLLLVCPEHDAEGEELHPHPLWDEIVSRVATGKAREQTGHSPKNTGQQAGRSPKSARQKAEDSTKSARQHAEGSQHAEASPKDARPHAEASPKNARQHAERVLLRASVSDIVGQSRREWLPVPRPCGDWTIEAGSIERREQESPSSVEKLLQCPFQWVLQYVAGLYSPGSAALEDGTSPRLLGDLLHAIMNRLFEGGRRSADQAANEAGAIFDREGPRLVAALFLPGADALRGRVRRAAVETARTLYDLMAKGRLRVVATEQARTGDAFGTKFGGRVDLVLGDPPRILDLKWRGARRKREALEQGTAVQLAAYAFLERPPGGSFPPVAYFVMDEQRLLTTAPDAFPGAERVDGPSPDDTWRLVEATHAQAWQTVAEGRVTAPGAGDEGPIEESSVEDGRLLLASHCRWCDYTVLCGLAFEEGA